MSLSKKHAVQFKGHHRVESGLYDTYEFAVVQQLDGNEDWIKVNISLALQIQLDIAGTGQLAPLAAKAVELHLLGNVPSNHYGEDGEKTIHLTIFWYPGWPGEPETITLFNGFEVSQG